VISELDESFVEYNHESGLKVQILLKPGYYKKFAMFSVNYGSIDSKFIVPGETTVTEVPDGVAHFLEHKLFEQKDRSVMDVYVEMGASPNAFTTYDRTCYYFTCTEEFDKCFELLLNYVLNPYLTDEGVEKEKGIIGQEIRMYQDNPDWEVTVGLLNSLYYNNPVKKNIAGSVESISNIDKEILYKCHKTFYHPSNMVVTVVGDVDESRIIELVGKNIPEEKQGVIERIIEKEPRSIATGMSRKHMHVSAPAFQIGFKDNNAVLTGTNKMDHEIDCKIVNSLLFSSSSALYEELYNKGLIDSSFYYDYELSNSFAFSVLGGESPDPNKVMELICKYIENVSKTGFDMKAFERVRNSGAGKFLKHFNSPEYIGRLLASYYFMGIDVFNYFTSYGKISLDSVEQAFKEVFSPENMAISVIEPCGDME
jgi:predicted Zn-dependent peptidase